MDFPARRRRTRRTADHWTARSETGESFRAGRPNRLAVRFGARRVRVAASATELFDYAANAPRYELTELPFDALVKRIRRPAAQQEPTLPDAATARSLVPRARKRAPAAALAQQVTGTCGFLGLGARGNRTPLHYDTAHNLFAQIHGRKRFTLFAPNERTRLDPHPRRSRHPHVSRIDPERPDLATFPKFSRAKAHALGPRARRAPVLPAGFWHHVRSLDVTVSVNTWWAQRLNDPAPPLQLAGRQVDRAADWANTRRAPDRLPTGPTARLH